MSENSAAERPKNLNILTILSFVGIGLFMIMGIFMMIKGIEIKGLFENPEAMEERRQMIFNNENISPEAKNEELAVIHGRRHFFVAGMAAILAQLFCLFGVFKMRKLKKTGFAFYSIGELGWPLAMSVFIGFGVNAIAGFAVALTMVILYTYQLKHMHL